MQELLELGILLKLTTVFFIIAAVITRTKNERSLWITLILVVALATFLHGFKDGWGGIRNELYGAILALLCTAPLYLLKNINGVDVAASCAAGGILGPIGFLTVLFIAVVLLLIQHLLHAEATPIDPYWCVLPASCNPCSIILEEKSALSRIEANRAFGRRRKIHSLAPPVQGKGEARHEKLLPWTMKIALATLAVLMIGPPL